MKRSEIWCASLPAPTGSGPGFRRPIVVIQSNPFNQSRIGAVVVAIVTSNLSLAEVPGNVEIGKADSGLPKPSIANVPQLCTLDRNQLTQRVRGLPAETMHAVEEGLWLGLWRAGRLDSNP